jgi:hypothetical protein
MSWRLGLIGAGGLCVSYLALVVPAALADGSQFVGHWHWNPAQSILPPGDVAPADMVADISRVDSTHVRWSLTVTNAQGRPAVESFDTPANGEFYPISSGTIAAFTLDAGMLKATFKGPTGETDALSCAVSPDQMKMTCNGTLTDTDGKSATYVDVYDRR